MIQHNEVSQPGDAVIFHNTASVYNIENRVKYARKIFTNGKGSPVYWITALGSELISVSVGRHAATTVT